MKITKNRKEEGITLVALVVTIIVLLILAAVTIAALSGDNGILRNAAKAKEETEKAQEEEQIKLEELEDTINEYAGIDWDKALADAEKHPDQVTSTVIGVGTDGRAVNMDLWEYTKLDDGTYALNSEETMTAVKEENWLEVKMGYLGTFTENGEIDGRIPQYIKGETDDTFIPVTDLTCLFARNENIKVMPDIPNTVINMNNTFLRCINLTTLSKIPVGVINMQSTFAHCTLIKDAPQIPNTVENMVGTFRGCSNLVSAPTIPNSVTNMQEAFIDCSKLTGIITINANLTGAVLSNGRKDYYSMLYNIATEEGCEIRVTGTCPILQEYVTALNRDNITLLD